MRKHRIFIAFPALFTILFLVVAALLFCSCSPTVVTEYDATTGKITKVTTSGGSELSTKEVSVGGAISAIKIETSGSSSTGTLLPNILLGGGASGISASPGSSTRPVMGASHSCGILNSLTNSSAFSGEVRYIGTSNESADETAKRLKALLDFQKGALSLGQGTDSGSANEALK